MTMGIFKIVHESCSRVGCTPLVRVDGPEFELHSRRKLNLPCRILHLHSDLQSFSAFFSLQINACSLHVEIPPNSLQQESC